MNNRRRITGFVTSNKMDKTVSVEITRKFRHPVYHKVVNTAKKVMAQDDLGCQEGDMVVIVESKPLSRKKRWVVQEILRRQSEDIELDIGAEE